MNQVYALWSEPNAAAASRFGMNQTAISQLLQQDFEILRVGIFAFGFTHDGRGGLKGCTSERLQTMKSFQNVVVPFAQLVVEFMSQLGEILCTRLINRLARLPCGTARLKVRKTQTSLHFSAISRC